MFFFEAKLNHKYILHVITQKYYFNYYHIFSTENRTWHPVGTQQIFVELIKNIYLLSTHYALGTGNTIGKKTLSLLSQSSRSTEA